jgi:outer membrane lipoprotein-sorting protein
MKFKKKYLNVLVPFIIVCFLPISFAYQKEEIYNVEDITDRMFEAMSNVKTMRYHLKIAERVNGKIEYRESNVKLQVSPRKLYLQIKSQEVLWLQGENGGNAFVNPGAFPYINLNLDPQGSLMRKDQHHTINELGLNYFLSILKSYKEKYADKFKKHFFITGEEVFNGRMCYKLSILIPEFGWENYTVKKGENIISIARKLHVSEYMILEGNVVKWYDDVIEGQIIQVPNAYSKFALLLVDKESMLPINNKMIDDKGLFESYQYLDLKVNTPIAPEEFTKNYKGYHF